MLGAVVTVIRVYISMAVPSNGIRPYALFEENSKMDYTEPNKQTNFGFVIYYDF